MHIVNIHEAKSTLSALLIEACNGGEVIIAKAGKPMVKLTPIEENLQPRELNAPWNGKVWIADDFDEIPAEFLPYIEVPDSGKKE